MAPRYCPPRTWSGRIAQFENIRNYCAKPGGLGYELVKVDNLSYSNSGAVKSAVPYGIGLKSSIIRYLSGILQALAQHLRCYSREDRTDNS
jgi:hypothetical protein